MKTRPEPVIRRVFITKYALTTGLYSEVCEQSIHQHGKKALTYWKPIKRGVHGFYREGTDAFLTEEAARKDVQRKAQSRVESLQKSLEKVEALAVSGYKTTPIEERPDPRVKPEERLPLGYMQGRGAS